MTIKRANMANNLFQTPEYSMIMEDHLRKTISYLFDKNQEFAIACQVKFIDFSPQLPQEIFDTFNETILFILSGYTFQSAKLEQDSLIFEAGFGSENFGSTVSVPLLAIKQLFVGDHPIVLNHIEMKSKMEKSSRKNSMDALMNNPKNKKLLKKN
jgi:hypothetical protein